MCYEFEEEYWEQFLHRAKKKADITEEVKRAVMDSEATVPIAEAR